MAFQKLQLFAVDDFLILDEVFQKGRSTLSKEKTERLVRLGVLEKLGRGKLMLARRFYEAAGTAGAYTRIRGLERPQQKELLIRHLQDCGSEGAAASELSGVLAELSRFQVLDLLNEWRDEKRVHLVGKLRGARWHIGTSPED